MEHSSKQYDLDLEAIRSRVLLMGGLVEKQFRDAMASFLTGDVELAEKVMRNDEEVNRLEVSLDSICTHLIVKRQPAANDLRTVMATTKVITDLERIGDEVTKIARSAKNIQSRSTLIINNYASIKLIADHAVRMLHDALDAFARMDRDLAIRLIGLDAVIDHEFHEMMRNLITFMTEEPQTISAALDLLWAAKAIERVGDHSTNIAEYVIYVVEGKDIRHTDYTSLFPERPI
jgi:phosphate transport system protein